MISRAVANAFIRYPMSYQSQTPQNMKKFFKQASFVQNSNPSNPLHRFTIKLDQRTMKTPYQHQLAVPTEILAFLVTSQFNRQDKHLHNGQMPMLALCRTAVDADIQGNIAEHLKHTLIEYLKTDTLNFYDDGYEEEYIKISKPIVNEFSKQLNMKFMPSNSLIPPKVENIDNFIKWVDSLNNWQLIGMETMAVWFKSTISAYALAHNFANLETIQLAATLEEVTQMRQNGEVDEKLMNLNQVRLMASCGLIMYQNGNPTLL